MFNFLSSVYVIEIRGEVQEIVDLPLTIGEIRFDSTSVPELYFESQITVAIIRFRLIVRGQGGPPAQLIDLGLSQTPGQSFLGPKKRAARD